MHERGPVSRATITEELSLARGTVGVLIDALVNAGLLVERSAEPGGTRGRPSPVIDVVSAAATVLAVDLAVDTARQAVVGLGGRILGSQERRQGRSDPPEARVARLIEDLRAGGRSRRRAGSAYQAVGVACWGVVRSDDGFVYAAPNLGWRDVPLGAMLAEGLAPERAGVRPLFQHVVVANDADLGAVAEYRRGAGVGARRLLYVHSDIGVGGGIVHDGRLIGADGGYAGEIGHMTVDPRGLRCGCGAVGCWETEVDERALVRAAGVDAGLDDASLRAAVYRVLGDARDGDRRASAAVQRVAGALGAGLASLVHILGPDRIVLGGYLADLLTLRPAPVRQVLRERGFSPEAREVPVLAAGCGEDAAIVGAAEYALEPLLRDPLGAIRRAGVGPGG